MKGYNLIKKLLQENPNLRDDKELLVWTYWSIEGSIKNNCIYYSDFKNATKQGTINRTRRSIQAKFPDLAPSEPVKRLRKKKQDTKGTFIFRNTIEQKPHYEFNKEKNCYVKVN